MSNSRFTRVAVVAVAATAASTVLAGTPALAYRDTTPPTAPRIDYAQGYNCLQVIVGFSRSTDNVTPQPQLKYDVFADGRFIGTGIDQDQVSGVWAWLHNVLTPGTNMITVKARDAAGNRSAPSRAAAVTGFPC
ncbi:MAG TPA: hypothetical protein VH912_14190 [Streptosporangiaceae bacterium]|jgi:hypothetical protein